MSIVAVVFVVRKNFASGIVLAAVCICIALNCYFDLAPGSFGWNLLKQLKNPDASLRALNNVDRLYFELPPDQNAFLSFKNFSFENEAFIELIYYRSGYAAYPGKVFTTASGTVINHGRDVLQSQFVPAEEWLDQNRIGRFVVFERTADGEITAVATARDLR